MEERVVIRTAELEAEMAARVKMKEGCGRRRRGPFVINSG
jgi:hypothetical protein